MCWVNLKHCFEFSMRLEIQALYLQEIRLVFVVVHLENENYFSWYFLRKKIHFDDFRATAGMSIGVFSGVWCWFQRLHLVDLNSLGNRLKIAFVFSYQIPILMKNTYTRHSKQDTYVRLSKQDKEKYWSSNSLSLSKKSLTNISREVHI